MYMYVCTMEHHLNETTLYTAFILQDNIARDTGVEKGFYLKCVYFNKVSLYV